jgi:transposase-like protein
VPAKTVDESMMRLLLTASQQESLTVYTDEFRAYEPLDEDDAFDREYVVTVTANRLTKPFTSTSVRATGRCCDPWLSPHRGVSETS